jgi:hypothetical protein
MCSCIIVTFLRLPKHHSIYIWISTTAHLPWVSQNLWKAWKCRASEVQCNWHTLTNFRNESQWPQGWNLFLLTDRYHQLEALEGYLVNNRIGSLGWLNLIQQWISQTPQAPNQLLLEPLSARVSSHNQDLTLHHCFKVVARCSQLVAQARFSLPNPMLNDLCALGASATLTQGNVTLNQELEEWSSSKRMWLGLWCDCYSRKCDWDLGSVNLAITWGFADTNGLCFTGDPSHSQTEGRNWTWGVQSGLGNWIQDLFPDILAPHFLACNVGQKWGH